MTWTSLGPKLHSITVERFPQGMTSPVQLCQAPIYERIPEQYSR